MKYTYPREHQVIKNILIELPKKYKNEYVFIPIYLDSQYILNVLRMDIDKNKDGWDEDLQVKMIINKHVTYVIYIGPSQTNIKKIFLKINSDILIEFYPINYPSSIPKCMIQTTKDYDKLSLRNKQAINSWLLFNPEYEHVLYDDFDCSNFLKNNFNFQVLKSFNKLLPGAYKADLFRICYLYKKGGVYIDHKMICLAPLQSYIDPNDTLLATLDMIPTRIFNGFIMSTRNIPEFKNIIDEIVYNCKHNIISEVFMITGPSLVYKHLDDIIDDYKLKHSTQQALTIDLYECYILYNNKRVVKIRYPGYYDENPVHYSINYEKKLIYDPRITL